MLYGLAILPLPSARLARIMGHWFGHLIVIAIGVQALWDIGVSSKLMTTEGNQSNLDRYRLAPRVGFMPPVVSTSISRQSGGTGLTNDLPFGQTTSIASGYVTKPITGTRLSCDQ